MRKTVLLSVLLSLCASMAVAQTRKTLDMYVVDVEGGNAVLFVTPSGESMLVDSGNGGAGAVSDAERIVAAAKDAESLPSIICSRRTITEITSAVLPNLPLEFPLKSSSITV